MVGGCRRWAPRLRPLSRDAARRQESDPGANAVPRAGFASPRKFPFRRLSFLLPCDHRWREGGLQNVTWVDPLFEPAAGGNQRSEQGSFRRYVKAASQVEQIPALARRMHPPQRHRDPGSLVSFIEFRSEPDIYLTVDVNDRAQIVRVAGSGRRGRLQNVRIA